MVLQLDYEGGQSCLLAPAESNEIIQILTKIATEIWKSPNCQKTPHTNLLYKQTDNEYY